MKRIELEGEIELSEQEGGYASHAIEIDKEDLGEVLGIACGAEKLVGSACHWGPEGSKSLGHGRIIIELEDRDETT